MDMDRALDRKIDQQAQDALPSAPESPVTSDNEDTALVTPTRKQKAYKLIDDVLAVKVVPGDVTIKQQLAAAALVTDRSDPKKTHVDVDIKHTFTKIDLSRVGGKPAPELEAGEPVTSIEAELVEPTQPEGGGGGGGAR